jgi:hypothetical protein
MEGRGAAGGLEKVAKDDAFNLTRAGHEVIFLYAGEATPFQFPFTTRCVNPVSKEAAIEQGLSTISWQNVCVKNVIDIIKAEKPDIMLYHSHTTSPAKKIIQTTGIPTLMTLHGFLTGNLFIDTGRITAYHELVKMGAYLVANTESTANRIYSQGKLVRDKYVKNDDDYRLFVDIIDQKLPFYNDHFENFMFVEEDYEIVDSRGFAVTASRADPLKLTHKIKDIYYPTRIFWKSFPSTQKTYPAWLEKQRGLFEHNANIDFRWNQPYGRIMDSFSQAKACLITWPDETFGLTAFEAAQKGVPSIIFHKGEPNCTREFLARVQEPVMIDYRNKDFLDQAVEALKSVDDSLHTRQKYALDFSTYFSYDRWIAEKEAKMRQAIQNMNGARSIANTSYVKTLFDNWS